MKTKKTICIFLALLLCMTCIAVLAESDPYDSQQEIPADVQAYIGSDGFLPAMRELLSESAGGSSFYSTAEDAQSIRLTKVLTLLEYRYENDLPMADDLVSFDSWLFLLDSDRGVKGLGFISCDQAGGLDWNGVVDASNLMDALGIMERLATEAGVEFHPVIVSFGMFRYFLYHSFNGDERVITVPAAAEALDSSYYEAVSYEQLPTAEELHTKLNSLPSFADKESVEYGGNILLKAKPASDDIHSANSLASDTTAENNLFFAYVIAGCAAAALIIAFVAVLSKKKRTA